MLNTGFLRSSQGISKFFKSQVISKLPKSWKKKIFKNQIFLKYSKSGNFQNYPEKQGSCT